MVQAERKSKTCFDFPEVPPIFAESNARACGEIGRRARLRIW